MSRIRLKLKIFPSLFKVLRIIMIIKQKIESPVVTHPWWKKSTGTVQMKATTTKLWIKFRNFHIPAHWPSGYSVRQWSGRPRFNPPCLTFSNIRYVSRVKWSNPGKGVAPSPTSRCSSYWKGTLLVALDYSRQLYNFIYIYEVIIQIFFVPFTPSLIGIIHIRNQKSTSNHPIEVK